MSLLIFDMDGVLVDPVESFRRALIETVRHFTGAEISEERIVELKNQGGFNNDDDIAVKLIAEDFGVAADRREVRRVGERLFWGENRDGLILNERRLFADGVLERLARGRRLAICTGRGRREASFTLERFCPHIRFEPIMTSDQLERQKPAPDGLLKILDAAAADADEAIYVGDNVDDARSARAAGVAFIGVAARAALRRDEIVELFRRERARAIIESVNELEEAL